MPVPITIIDVLCPGKLCGFEDGKGRFLYRDEYSHVSVEGAKLTTPVIASQLGIELPAAQGATGTAETNAR